MSISATLKSFFTHASPHDLYKNIIIYNLVAYPASRFLGVKNSIQQVALSSLIQLATCYTYYYTQKSILKKTYDKDAQNNKALQEIALKNHTYFTFPLINIIGLIFRFIMEKRLGFTSQEFISLLGVHSLSVPISTSLNGAMNLAADFFNRTNEV